VPGVAQARGQRRGTPEALIGFGGATKQRQDVRARDVCLGQLGIEPQRLLARTQRLGAKRGLFVLRDEQPLEQVDVRLRETRAGCATAGSSAMARLNICRASSMFSIPRERSY